DYSFTLWCRGPESSTPIRPGRFYLDLEPGLKPGVFLHGDSTLFRIFAPRATRVTLVVLDHPDSWHIAGYHPLLRLSDGMWETVLEENMTGKYYWYRVDGPREGPFSHFDPNFNILDPYALATVGPGGPAIVVDRRRHAKPRAFKPPHPEDLVIGEVHLRDLLAKAPIRLSEPERLGYTGLTAWLKSPHCYLRGWGVNAVELQPIHENDALSEGDYHWGYMPVNYFSPESGYARDPLQASQVEEFRDLVEAFHEAGLAVILDVVYNHVGNPAHLAYIDQLYYFELKADGTPSNWSGCGNDLRCHAPMAKQLILDSLLHMLEFYGVDGFRFDLAELFGVEVLRAIEIRLREQFPEVILIAEPWSFRAHLRSGLKNTGYLWWNDGYREFLKSYLTGKGDAVRMQYFLTGSHSSVGAPFQSINYTGSHDDRTWLDDITENANHNAQAPTQLERRRTHLMVSLLMMSLGTPMLAQGQDFLRTKWGHANTYLRGDINALDYQRLQDFSGTHAYFRCWIAFRQSEMASCLRLATMPGEDFFQFFSPQSGNGLACLFNAAEEHGPVQLFFVVNPEADPVRFNLAGFHFDRSWSQIADSERFEPDGLDSALAELRAELEMPAASCALWISRPG
ncbi:MAG: glycoside hydrolase family 1, partial [Opitutae bacterium]|nr:glycoside hydrolase family 1 [Opitutae bacterium]